MPKPVQIGNRWFWSFRDEEMSFPDDVFFENPTDWGPTTTPSPFTNVTSPEAITDYTGGGGAALDGLDTIGGNGRNVGDTVILYVDGLMSSWRLETDAGAEGAGRVKPDDDAGKTWIQYG